MKVYYNYARTALKIGLINNNIRCGDTILIPNYICEAVIQPLEELELNIKFYSLNNDLSVNLNSINSLISKSVKAILIVNFFGYVDNGIFLKLFRKKSFLIIEDNCHTIDKDLLLTSKLSSLSIYSPRKLLGTKFGAILVSKKAIYDNYVFSPFYYFFQDLNKFLLKNLKQIFKRFLKKRPEYENIDAFYEKKVSDQKLNKLTSIIIENYNWNFKYSYYKINFNLWIEKLKSFDNKLFPYFNKYPERSIPLYFIVKCNDKILFRDILIKGWELGLDIKTWPILPIKNRKSKNVLKIWNSLLCFPLDVSKKSINEFKI